MRERRNLLSLKPLGVEELALGGQTMPLSLELAVVSFFFVGLSGRKQRMEEGSRPAGVPFPPPPPAHQDDGF